MKRRGPLQIVWVLFLMLAVGTAQAALPEFTGLVQKNSPAVVNIRTVQVAENSRTSIGPEMLPDLPDGSPFNDFFNRFFEAQPEIPQEHRARGVGSGFIISSDGEILTNAHVVKDSDEIIVRLSDERELPAKVLGIDERTDVALIKVDADNLPVVKIGNSDDLAVGEWVLAIGSPFGFEHTATQGIVSAIGRNLPSETYVPFIQTDVAVNPGNSGGPLFNTEGKVVGVNSQIFSRSGGYMGLSFAIPINVAMNISGQLKEHGHVSRGWLGVTIQPVTRELAESFGLDRPRGALIAEVSDGSPADKAGLKRGDIILEYDGRAVSESAKLPPMVGSTKVESKVRVKILRGGSEKTMRVRIRPLEDPDQVATASPQGEKGRMDKMEMSVAALGQEERKNLGLKRGGVRVTSVASGPAARAGIRPGDVILSINNKPIEGVGDLKGSLDSLPDGKPVPVLVQRDSNAIFLALTVPKA
ncbi:MAG: DegQ family serine endoprotease [Gammaproteobacteria bacterium]|nr:DegQ family serine endoprotease [Gammaproteobacteria bacterium]